MARFIFTLLLIAFVFGCYWLIDKLSKNREEKHKQRIQELELELRLEKEKNKQKGENLKN